MSGQILKILHKFAITVCATQLTFYTSPLMAQPVRGSGNIVNEGVSPLAEVGMGLLEVTNQAAQTYLQARQQSFAALQQVSLMQQLQPRTQFDKYFGCPIPESNSAFVQNACETPDPSQITTYMALQDIADGYEDYYGQLLNPAQNGVPVGLQCLDESKRRVLNGMETKLKQMQELRAQLKKSQQQFRDDQQQLLSEMSDLKDELEGRKGTKAGDDTNTFRNEVGDDCANILGNIGINIDTANTKGGFIGMLQGMEKPNLKAANFVRDKRAIEREVNDVINQIKADIARDGIDNWGGNSDLRNAYFAKLLRGKANFGSALQTVIAPEQAILMKNIQVYTQDIADADPNFRLPKKDANFSVNLENFIDVAKRQYRNDEIGKCVRGEEYGLGLTGADILRSLYLPNSKNRETQTLRDYRSAFQGILDANIPEQQKLEELEALDKEYGKSVRMRFTDNQSVNQENVQPYDYLKGYISDCENEIPRDGSTAPINRAVASINKIKKEIDRFSENIGAQIDAQLNNCNGAKLKADKCGPESINVEGANFCIPHATQCSAKINACYKKIQNGVQQRQENLNNKANAFNDRMENYVANQEQILQQIRNVANTQAEFLTRFFESDAVDLHIKDLFIPMPEMSDENEFGLKLRGNGSLDVMKEMDKKLELVQSQIKRQKTKLADKLEQHKNNIEDQLALNRTKWKDLKDRCKATENAIRQAADKQNQEGAEKQAELDKKVGAFCRKFESLGELNPGPGCDGDDSPEALFGDIHDVAGQIDPRVRSRLLEYRNLCASINNEADSDDSTGKKDSVAPLISACNDNGGNWENAYKDLVKKYINEAAEDFDQDDIDTITEFFKSEDAEFPDDKLSNDFKESGFANIAKKLQGLHPRGSSDAASSLAGKIQSTKQDAFNENFEKLVEQVDKAVDMYPKTGDNAYYKEIKDSKFHFPSKEDKEKSNNTIEIKSLEDLANLLKNKDRLTNGISQKDMVQLRQDGEALINVHLVKARNSNAEEKEVEKVEKGKQELIKALNIARDLKPEDRRAPASNGNDSDEKGKNDNLCTVLRDNLNQAKARIRRECDNDDTSKQEKCEDERKNEMNQKLEYVPSYALKNVNAALSDINSVTNGQRRQLQDWRNIGERSSGLCKSRSTASRNGLINQDVFNQMIGGGAPAPLPIDRNGFGVQ